MVEPDEGVGNVLEMPEFAVAYFEELDLHVSVQGAFERHSESARLFSQGKRFYRVGEMDQQPFSGRVGTPEGHEPVW